MLVAGQVLGSVIVVIIVNPLVLAMFLPLLCLFLALRRKYLIASREIKRLASVNR